MKKRLEAIIYGKVQGVGYRYFTVQKAAKYGIKGFVRNLPDGSVKVVAEGEEENLKNFLKELYKGPPRAIVDDIKVTWEECKNEFDSFEIRY